MDISQYSDTIQEKIKRISDILVQINKISLLKNHLSFYGGTALNFIYLDAPRLSEDLDFNFRETDKQDWGEVRKEIDGTLKRILYDLGYEKNKIKIQPIYNLCRFHIKYVNPKGLNDSIKIETGYMRRIPILKTDTFKQFIHPITEQKIDVKTPIKEELFANKFCTLFSRENKSARDIYDVHSISLASFDLSLFVDVVMVESLFMNIDIINFQLDTLFDKSKITQIQDLVSRKIDWDIISKKVKSFIKNIQIELKARDYSKFMSDFLNNDKIDVNLLSNKNKLNNKLNIHPLLLWLIKKRS